MKPVLAFVLSILTLVGCGVDGEPPQPAAEAGQQSVPVTGTATAGMAVGSSGTRGYGALGVTNGPISLTVGF